MITLRDGTGGIWWLSQTLRIPRQIQLPVKLVRRMSKLMCILGRGVLYGDTKTVQTASGEAAMECYRRDFSEAVATIFVTLFALVLEETAVSGSSSQLQC